MEAQPDNTRKRLLIGLAAVAVVAAVIAGVLLLADDDDPSDAIATTSTEATTTTTDQSTSSTTSEPPVAALDPDLPVFPDPTASLRFDDPVAAATAFITDLVGFSDPTVGPFQQGDPRSGEVEVRPFPEGAPTVVLLRQLEDDNWFVIGAETDSIRLATPAAREQISSPQPLTGQAYAFEGNVRVRLYADGTEGPIAETFVTGRGDGVLGDFDGELTFDVPAGTTHGVLVLTSAGLEDASAIAAQVIRVKF